VNARVMVPLPDPALIAESGRMESRTTHRRNKPSDVGFAGVSYALAAFPPARRGRSC
jgi:hypothetical protein